MSSSSVTTRIVIGDRRGFLQILDSNLSEIATGVGEASIDLEPGIYKARASLGDASSETFFSIGPDSPEPLVLIEPLQLSSAVPMLQRTDRQKHQQDILEEAIAHPTLDAPFGGSAVFVFCARFPASVRPGRLPTFRLRTAEGELVCDLSARSASRHDAAGIQATAIMIKPGHYVLSHEPPDGLRSAIAVHPVKGWRSQHYFRVDTPGSEDMEGVPDFAGCAVSMARSTAPPIVRPDEERVAEAARRSLAEQRNSLTPAEMHELLMGKFSDPVLGLLAANLLLLHQKPDIRQLEVVTQSLGRMLGANFPDVVALGIALHDLGRIRRRKPNLGGIRPPLLLRSWHRIWHAARGFGKRPRHLPAHAKGGGPWFMWNARESLAAETNDASPLPFLDEIEAGPVSPTTPLEHADVRSLLLKQLLGIDWEAVGEAIATESPETMAVLSDAQKSIIPILQLMSSEITKGRKVFLEGLDAARQQLDLSWPEIAEGISSLGEREAFTLNPADGAEL